MEASKHSWRHAVSVCLVTAIGAFAALPAAADEPPKTKQTITLAGDSEQATADEKKVLDAVIEIRAGRIQQAIDGPLTEVVNRYEKQFGDSHDAVYSARGPMQALMYTAGAATKKAPNATGNAMDVGPAWAMAYWGRGYGYSEMNRFRDAEVELKKAIALSPSDAQYISELAYVYQMEGRFAESIELYKSVPDTLYLMDDWTDADKIEYRCKSFRGQGYDLVELKRLDEAEAAYKACIALMPGEPKSLGELEYIKALRAKGG